MQNSLANKVIKGTIVVTLVGVTAKLFGFFSEAVLAAYLGTTYQSDAYYTVSSMKDIILSMLGIGVWKVFLPLYKNSATNNIDTADELANKTITFFSVVTIIVTALVICFAPAVVTIFAPGYKNVARETCIRLVQVSAPSYVFIMISAVFASILQSHNRFFGSQIREVVSHIPTIIAAIVFYRRFGINALAIALIASSVLRLAVQLPFVTWGYRFKFDFHFKTPEFLLLLKRLPSAMLSAGIVQINSLIDKAMASTLPTGAISELHYGQKLMNVFSGLLSAAIATALYPQMIELITLEKRDELSKLIVKIVSIFCVIMFPVTIASILFRNEMISAVFQRGSFKESSVGTTGAIFALYCIGLFFSACNTVISNVFYGYGDTKTPMYISIANLAINVILNFVLIHLLGVTGLALATSLSAVITFFIRLAAAKKYVCLDYRVIAKTAIKALTASAIACLIPRIFFWFIPANKYFVLLVSIVVGMIMYLLSVKLFKMTEVDELLALLKKKLKKT